MKNKLLIAISLAITTLTSCGQDKFKSVDAQEFEKLIQNETTIVLDVRTQEEYEQGHIANAKNIDVKLCTFTDKAKENLDKNKTIAVYCRSGKRSVTAANLLTHEGYNVINLKGGIIEWQNAHKKVEK